MLSLLHAMHSLLLKRNFPEVPNNYLKQGNQDATNVVTKHGLLPSSPSLPVPLLAMTHTLIWSDTDFRTDLDNGSFGS